MHDLAIFANHQVTWLPGTEKVVAISPDFKYVVLQLRNQPRLTLWKLPRPWLTAQQKLGLTLHYYLKHNKHAELNRLFSWASQSRAPFAWDRDHQSRTTRMAGLMSNPVGITHDITGVRRSLVAWASRAENSRYARQVLNHHDTQMARRQQERQMAITPDNRTRSR